MRSLKFVWRTFDDDRSYHFVICNRKVWYNRVYHSSDTHRSLIFCEQNHFWLNSLYPHHLFSCSWQKQRQLNCSLYPYDIEIITISSLFDLNYPVLRIWFKPSVPKFNILTYLDIFSYSAFTSFNSCFNEDIIANSRWFSLINSWILSF